MIPKTSLTRERASRIAANAIAISCVVTLVLLARPASTADLADLRNGFSIRHEHRQLIGATTRLFFSADDSSFTDVPTEVIASFEKDLSAPPPGPSANAVSPALQKSAS